MTEKMDDTSVKVAVRVRPQLAKEKIDMCQICTLVTPDEPQIVLNRDKAFTFDYVFDLGANQDQIYQHCSKELIDGTFEGYNATIFAYGQTGSGKTYTMGTGFDMMTDRDLVGIIPRAVEHLFNGIEERKCKAMAAGEPVPDFKVNAQFMELYNEEILDLLDTTRDPSEKGRKSHIRIHEDASGGIYTVGVTTRPVTSLQDTMHCLKTGALCRTTASTNMNAQSSRSHAIFTLHIRQHRLAKPDCLDEDGKERDSTEVLTEFEMLSAKFHFVDLAGSERLKRTGATGERAKEGISINCGLLALGNVISALGDKTKKSMHVPYRDSKLTRLLQDSLGGNSRTVMIACISPSDRDFMETLNTLKYANRARNIKNKVMVNQDKTSKQIASLRTEIQALQAELLEYKTGNRYIDAEGMECDSDMRHENRILQAEINNLRQRVKALHETVESLTLRNIQLLADRDAVSIAAAGVDTINEEAKMFIEGYIKEMEELRAKLVESDALVKALKRSSSRMTPSQKSLSPMLMMMSHSGTTSTLYDFNTSPEAHIQDILCVAKKDVKHLKTLNQPEQHPRKQNVSDDEKRDNEDDREDGNKIINGDEMEDEDDGEEDDTEDGDDVILSDVETDAVTDKLHENLADLTCEISIKQKLIEELELSQKRLHTLKVQYEQKLTALENKIKETELERDHVLSNLGDVESHSEERENKVREEYERKLNDMKNELKKLEAAKKEHTKLIRNQSHYEKQFKTLQHDLSEMKKLKVQLMNKIQEETQKNRISEIQRNKEINQLKKEQRLKDSHIKTLETEKRQKELILRRKQEEVESLRRRQRPVMSAKTAGRTGKYEKEPTIPIEPALKSKKRSVKFNPKTTRAIWDNLEKSVSSIVVKKQTIGHFEKDMERWMKQREHLGKKLERFVRKLEKTVADNVGDSAEKDLQNQIETLKDNISFIQDNINECQTSIMQMEESKDDDIDPNLLLSNCSSLDEAKYLLEHCVSMIISKGLLAAQKESEGKELIAKLHQERMDSTFQRDMLQYLIQDKVDIEIDDSLISHRSDSDSESDLESSETNSPVESVGAASPTYAVKRIFDEMLKTQLPPSDSTNTLPQIENAVANTTNNSITSGRRDKARRKTATPEDLLFAGGVVPSTSVSLLMPLVENPEDTAETLRPSTVRDLVAQVRDSTLMPPPKALPPRVRQNGISSQLPRPDSISLKPEPGPSPNLPRKTLSTGKTASVLPPDPSPVLKRKVLSSSVSSGSGSLSKLSSISDTNTGDMTTPPTSPTFSRKQRDGNVFSRLTSRTQPASPHPTRGVISTVPTKSNQNCPLIHSFTASGHSKAVLAVYATDELLFSSSKDRTTKIWDLQTGEEMLTLNAHPNNVVSVKYSEATSLVYTVSSYIVKIWDPRQGNMCIKTLTSSGLTSDGTALNNTTSRQVACPPGEINIADVALNSMGTVLYSAAGNTVRIWDLKMFKSVGKLSGGHQAAVMALAIDDTDTADGNICVVTGSKDHYIKVFEVMEDSVGVLCPKYNLEPPHYDGIQSLCLMGDLLFSGSRDTCIKKWDLAEQQLRQSINNAHKDWICGLTFMPGANCLVSGCRAGMLKVWHIDNCSLIGEIQAHNSPLNAICSNSNMLFSASNDKTVHFWKTLETQEASDSSDY